MTAECFHGNCLEIMKQLPDKSINLFLCDLPYGCLHQGFFHEKKDVSWDKQIDMTEFWKQIKRLCMDDHTPVIMFGDFVFSTILYNTNSKWFRHEIIWNKMYGTNALQVSKRPLKAHEYILVFSKKSPHYNSIVGDDGRSPISIQTFPRSSHNKRHPTEKNILLYEWLIKRYSKEGDVILDPTAGSFNSGRASLNLKRNYIGIEMNDEYFEKNHINPNLP